MNHKPINVFIIDDDFPKSDEFRSKGVYNSAISMEDLYHLAVNNNEWQHLSYLQQLIKDIYTSESRLRGEINLIGFSTPTQALKEIESGILPNVVIYDWEYLNSPAYSKNSTEWLLKILVVPNVFVFVYSNLKQQLPKYLNHSSFNSHFSSFQLFSKKGEQIPSSFKAEEFIFQHIIGLATDRGEIKINGINIEFTKNSYLKSASEILYLQRILGSEYVLDELSKIEFRVNELGVEKILNDSKKYLLFSEKKNILLNPSENKNIEELEPLIELSYAEVIKRFSLDVLEDTLERGFLVI
jgi:hypothetical protein